ncbi:DUF3426 domain-containing protein [Rhodoblastus sp.]|uniref:DUF3426 domain-containing protein n=1 Tax=Rhodoblastus sp. TaxID=1962975 RepID=UPI00262F504A|nr:DUF3426 domain-containing protein [Rhodoblastus sp.]
MPSASLLSPIEDRTFGFALHRDEAGRPWTVSAQASVRSSKRVLGPVAWVFASFGVWALLVGTHARIARLAPTTAPLFAALGLDVNPTRMGVDHVASRLDYEDGRQILIVDGEIRNLASTPRAAPRMRLSVLDAGGREIYHWIAAPPKARLAAGETAEFRARLAAPPKDGQRIRVRLAGGPESPAAPW